jgi:hypothetical protein
MEILLLSFFLFSNLINALKEGLNSTNKITKIILDNKLPKPTAWKIYEFSESIKGRKDIWLDRNYSKRFFNSNNKIFFDYAEVSYFIYLKKIYYSSIPLNKKIKTFKTILFYMDIIKHGLIIVQFQFLQILFGN